jgi:hypothetical protein
MRQRSEVIVDMVVAYDADSLLWGANKNTILVSYISNPEIR